MDNTKKEIPVIIKGGIYEDIRGKLCHFNELDLSPIKRVYMLEHPNTDIIRAWQAHQNERKWFKVLKGVFKMVLVKIDDWSNPSPDLTYEEFILYANKEEFLHIPKEFATGFQALEPYSKVMVFSDTDLEGSSLDDFRYDKSMWYKW